MRTARAQTALESKNLESSLNCHELRTCASFGAAPIFIVLQVKTFDPIRRKSVAATPEEAVRQAVVRVLLEKKHVPRHLIEVEFPLSALARGTRDRVDLVVHEPRAGLERPWLLVECKVPGEYTWEKLEAQLNRYLKHLSPKFILLALGETERVYRLQGATYEPCASLPDYAEDHS